MGRPSLSTSEGLPRVPSLALRLGEIGLLGDVLEQLAAQDAQVGVEGVVGGEFAEFGHDAGVAGDTVGADLVQSTEVNRNYQKSDLLQLIRVFKNYDLFKSAQMELFQDQQGFK